MLMASVYKSYNTTPDTLYFGAQDTLHFRQFLDQAQVQKLGEVNQLVIVQYNYCISQLCIANP